MKLSTPKGQLDLPRDFAITIERTNPLLSDQGDASVPATLPASSNNLAVLGHMERTDRAGKYANKVEAILEIGPIRKRGQLVIDTVHRLNGIDASFAIDNSDLYSTSKKKTLKEIFGNLSVTFETAIAAATKMQGIYEGRDADYVVFPVAVAAYEDKVTGEKVYQYNNEIDNGRLVWEERNVHEGDIDDMHVPDCYGLAPFLKLYRLVEILFSRLGYEVTENCLSAWPFRRMAVVHNCSDCLCNPTYTLYYRDMVPSCTLSDFLTWLCNKFHTQPVVDSETKQVKIVAMETMLTRAPDLDISSIVEGDFAIQLNSGKRIVLTPNTVEGAEPAAETFDKLIEKYGSFDYVDEAQFSQYPTATPPVNAPLVQRRSTGFFYAVELNSSYTVYSLKPIGTNNFTYDRANSEDTEDFSQDDLLPLMLCGLVKPAQTTDVVPFIGERLHAHTSYDGSAADDRQDIIVVQYLTDSNTYYMTTGTTQPVIPYANLQSGLFIDLGVGTCPYELYDSCWSRYNTILLNHPTNLKGRVRYGTGQILGLDMTRLKHCAGQRLLPVSASGSIGAKTALTDAEFLLVKTFVDGIADSPIAPSQTNLKWEVTDNLSAVVQACWSSMGGGANFGRIDVQDMSTDVEDHYILYGGHSEAYLGDPPQPGFPSYLGETKRLTRAADITITYTEVIEYSPDNVPPYSSFGGRWEFPNETVTFTFTAVND